MSLLLPLYADAFAVQLALPSLDDKLAAFRAFCEAVLRLHDPAFAVVTHIEESVTEATSRRDRLRVMGDPPRYCEVLWQGDDGTFETPDDVRHRVAVFLYYGLGTESHAAAAASFRALTEGRSASAPGLLHAIRLQGEAPTANPPGCPTYFSNPENVQTALVRPADGEGDWQHEATFTLTLS